MNEQFRPASADSPAGYGPGRTSRGELREGDPQPYRIRRVNRGESPSLSGHQPGSMQERGGNYSQEEIDNWEVDEGNPWMGGYGSYPGGSAAPYPGYSAGPIQQQMWPLGMQQMQQMQQQAHNLRQMQ